MALSLSSSVKVIAGVWDAETQTWFGSRTKHPLQERRAALRHDIPYGFFHFLQRRVFFRRPSVSKAVGAVQIAPLCHLQQGAAGADLVFGANAAVFGAAEPSAR